MRENFLSTLEETGIIAVLRLNEKEQIVLDTVNAIIEGGIRIIEITMTTPNALSIISYLNSNLSNHNNVIIGAGTVTDSTTARLAIINGAQFIVSPIFDADLVKLCKGFGIPIISGCMTPTEIFNAVKNGSDIIKTFPGRICTPQFFVDILGPFPFLKMIPTGKVNEITASEYIKAGAIGVAVGQALIGDNFSKKKDFEEVKKNSSSFIQLVKIAKMNKAKKIN